MKSNNVLHTYISWPLCCGAGCVVMSKATQKKYFAKHKEFSLRLSKMFWLTSNTRCATWIANVFVLKALMYECVELTIAWVLKVNFLTKLSTSRHKFFRIDIQQFFLEDKQCSSIMCCKYFSKLKVFSMWFSTTILNFTNFVLGTTTV